ncbi:MAG: hypothetical protein Q9181_002501 [Wetmoreana brouardii]
MRVHCRYLLAFLHIIFFCAAAAVTTATPTLAGQTGPSTNLSTIPDLPNENFEYRPRYQGALIRDTLCMMVCIRAMRDLALEAFHEEVRTLSIWRHPEFPGAAVAAGPSSQGGVTTVRFLMWLLLCAIRDMMARNNFQTSEFKGLYLGRDVGVVRFIVYPRQTSEITTTAASKDAGVAFVFNATGLVGTDPSSNDKLEGYVTYLDKAIERNDIFLAICWIVLNLAPNDKTRPLDRIVTTINGVSAAVTTIWNKAPQAGAAAAQFTAGSLLGLVTYLPEILLRENKFREMNVEIGDQGIVIGRGLFRSSPLPGSTETS